MRGDHTGSGGTPPTPADPEVRLRAMLGATKAALGDAQMLSGDADATRRMRRADALLASVEVMLDLAIDTLDQDTPP